MVQSYENGFTLPSTGTTHLDEDPPTPLSPSDEARVLKTLQTTGICEDTPRYISKKWWDKWCRYTKFEGEDFFGWDILDSSRPGPVERPTSNPDSKDPISAECVEISSAMWNQLVQWYSEAKQENSESRMNTIRLKYFHPKRHNRKLLTLLCRPTEKVGEVCNRMASILGFLRCRCYLFDPVKRQDFSNLDSQTLQETGIEDNSILCVLPTVTLDRRSGRVGLMNIGNTCYMNSSLQCLLHIPELMQYFLSGTFQAHINTDNPDGFHGKFAHAFCRLLKKVWEGESDQISPYQFWDVLSKYYILFAEKDQHDTAELVETVLDGLMEDCNLAAMPKPYFPEMKDDQSISDEAMAQEFWTYHENRSKSFITDKFHGQYKILTKCPNCDFESRKFDSFAVLQLGLPPQESRTINFTLVHVSGIELPRRYAVEVSSKALIKDLFKQVLTLLNQDELQSPWSQFCFILKRSKIVFLQLQDHVAKISDFDELVVYSYEDCEYGPASGGRKTCLVHQKLVQTLSHYSSFYSSSHNQREEKQEFGFPLVVWIPEKDLTSRSPKRALFQSILERFLKPFKRPNVARIQQGVNRTALFSNLLEKRESEDSNADSEREEVCSRHCVATSEDSRNQNGSENDPGEDQEMLDYSVDFNDVSNEPRSGFELAEVSPERNPGDSEHSFLIGPLFDDANDRQEENRTFNFTSGCNMDSNLSTISYGSDPAVPYTLSEVRTNSKSDEILTVLIEWDKNAQQYYILHRLEHPLVHFTAENTYLRSRKTAESVSIYDCLDHEFNPHPLALDGDNLWECGSCKKMVKGVKSMKPWKTPDILLLCLKRFDYCEARDRLVKLTQMVDYPIEGLDLSRYCAPIGGNKDDSIYDLFAVCYHHGYGPKFGHYTSTVKSPEGDWIEFNDAWSRETHIRTVVDKDAYLLYYRKRGLEFPKETEVLEQYLQIEREKAEAGAVEIYESMDSGLNIHEEDGTMKGLQMKSRVFGGINRGDNSSSSSSNEMNNENEISVQGSSSSSTLYLTSGPSNSTVNDSTNIYNQSRTNEVAFGAKKSEKRSEKRQKDDSNVFWPKQNNEIALETWNASSCVDNWGPEDTTTTEEKDWTNVAYNSSLYSAFSPDSQNRE